MRRNPLLILCWQPYTIRLHRRAWDRSYLSVSLTCRTDWGSVMRFRSTMGVN